MVERRSFAWWAARVRFAIYRALRAAYRLALFPIALPVVAVILLLRRWVDLRVLPVNTSRFGHLFHDLDYRLTERDNLLANNKSWYLATPFRVDLRISSRLGVKMWRDCVKQKNRTAWLPSAIGVPLVWAIKRLGLESELILYNPKKIGGRFNASSDVFGLTLKSSPNLRFSEKLASEAESHAKRMGLDLQRPIVCVHVRERHYHSVHARGLWVETMQFRNGQPLETTSAAARLADLGYQVVRMGVNELERLGIADEKRIFDYATNGFRSELLDLYLVSKCQFILTNGTGLDAAAQAFRKPIYNFSIVAPMMLQIHRKFQICMQIENISSGIRLSLQESLRLPKITDESLMRQGLRLIPNSPEEIAEFAEEAAARDRGVWKSTFEQQQLQSRALAILPSEFRRYGIRAGFGSEFLQRHRDWLAVSLG